MLAKIKCFNCGELSENVREVCSKDRKPKIVPFRSSYPNIKNYESFFFFNSLTSNLSIKSLRSSPFFIEYILALFQISGFILMLVVRLLTAIIDYTTKVLYKSIFTVVKFKYFSLVLYNTIILMRWCIWHIRIRLNLEGQRV